MHSTNQSKQALSVILPRAINGVRDPEGTSLWLELVLWAYKGFNNSTATVNSGMRSSHKGFYGGRLPTPYFPFCNPAYHCVRRRREMNLQARPCFILNYGHNHGSDYFKVMDVKIGMVVHSRDVTWHQPREPLTSSVPTFGSRISYLSSGAVTPGYVYIHPPLVPSASLAAATAPVLATAAPVPASAPPLATAPAPTPPLPPLAPIPDRVVWELGHGVDVQLSGRTRGETYAMQNLHHSMDLMSISEHAWLTNQLANRRGHS